MATRSTDPARDPSTRRRPPRRDETSAADDAEVPVDAEVDDGAAGDAAHVCPVGFCPIGATVNATGAVRPEAIGHLLAAGRELLLAARAVMDPRTEEVDSAVSDFRKIDIG